MNECKSVAAMVAHIQRQTNDYYSLILMKRCEPKKYAITMIKRQPFFGKAFEVKYE